MAESKEEEPISLKVRAEKIAESQLPTIDCKMMDARSRKVIVFLIEQELKKLNTFPTEYVDGSIKELEGIKQGLELCNQIRAKRKVDQDAVEGSSTSGQSETST